MNIKNLHLATIGSLKSVLELEIFLRDDNTWGFRTTPDRPDIRINIHREGHHIFVQPEDELFVNTLRVRAPDNADAVKEYVRFEAFIYLFGLEILWLTMPFWKACLYVTLGIALGAWRERCSKKQ